VLQEIAQHWSFPPFGHKKSFELSAGDMEGRDVALLAPTTFMNDSGRAVGECASFYKLSPAAFLVIHDDLDLAPGVVRLKQGGGSGGHKGLRSIDAVLGNGYGRLRIGIGHPGARELVIPYVLSPFASTEKDLFSRLFSSIARHFPLLVRDAPDLFLQEIQKDAAL
jgi:PTH1 family peptidyl-tRNA hydrolase